MPPPIGPTVLVTITRQPSGSIDGIQLDDFIVGFTYDVGTMLACYLLAERLAEPVADEGPTLVTSIRKQVRFHLTNTPAGGKEVSIRRPSQLRGTTIGERCVAADRLISRRRRKGR